MPDISDNELLHMMRAGDARALGALFRRHGPRIHRYVVRRTADPEGAEGITVRSFLDLWSSRNRVEPDGTGALPLLYGHATHRLPGVRRPRSDDDIVVQGPDALPSVRPTVLQARAEVAREAHELLGRSVGLRRALLDVLILSEWEGLSPSDIATAVGASLEQVESRLREALDRVGELLHHRGVQGVERLRAVERDRQDGAVRLDEDVFRHGGAAP